MLRAKIIALIALSALLSFSAISQEQDVITIDFFYPSATDDSVVELFERYAEQFHEANPDVRVNLTYAGGYDDITAAAQNALENGTPGPDVGVLLVVDLFDFIEDGAILPAQDFIDAMENGDDYLADFFPAFMENSIDGEGTVWTIPFQRSTPILFYNRDMFRDVGLDPDQPPRNREELIDYGEALLEEVDTPFLVPSAGFPYWFFQSFAIAHGQNVVGQDPTEVYFNAPEVIEAAEFFRDLGRVHGIAPEESVSFVDAIEEFLDENAGMIYHTTGNLTFVRQNADFQVGVGFLPSGPANEEGEGYGAPTGGGNLYIFSTTTPAEREAAWRWVQFLTSPEIQADWTVNTGYIAARQSTWETETLQDLVERFPEYSVARAQLAFAGKELTAFEGIRIRSIFNDALARIFAGEVDAQEALNAAQAEADAILEEYR